MTRQISPSSSDPSTAPLVAVDRAAADLRRGAIVVVRTGGPGVTLVIAAEAAGPATLADMRKRAGAEPQMVVTARRARVLGLTVPGADTGVVRLSAPVTLDFEMVASLADPCRPGPIHPGIDELAVAEVAGDSAAAAAVALAKVARLLPAAVFVECEIANATDLPMVIAADVFGYQQTAARTLQVVSEARVPLKDAENARIIAFRPSDGGIEHLAILIGEPDPNQPVLTRLHSECFTGDLLGSLRCDCGDQLRGAIAAIAQAGSGALLYLAQEGRGIGLVNKLRAYQLQDLGFDTLDANLQLGFDDDERIYQPAAQMLRLLKISRVRLMTNNPAKVEAMGRHGIEVVERVPHIFPTNDHNQFYLRTKQVRSGHLF